MRTREVRLHAVDLDNGASFSDMPAPVLKRLLADIAGTWHTRGTDTGLLLSVTDPRLSFGDTAATDPTVNTGPLPAVVTWAAGRGSHVVAATGPAATEGVPVAPKWI